MRAKLLIAIQCVYAAGGLIASVPLMLLIGPAGDVENGTSVRLLGAALFALGAGAVAAARDPARNRGVLLVEIVFSALATLVLIFKVAIHHSHAGFDERVYAVLAVTLVALILLLVTYPYGRRPHGAGRGRRRSGVLRP